MARLHLVQEQIESLEFQTSQVYDSLSRAVKTKEHQDTAWAAKIFNPLCDSLYIATGNSAFMDWNRGTQRADLLDRYLLQFALGNLPAIALKLAVSYEKIAGKIWDFKATDVSEEDVRAALDNKKIPYSKLQMMAMHLGDAGHFDDVIKLITYVRDTYRKPKL